MPSKLRKAIGAVKDSTSIGLAKVSPTSNLEIAILKATTHDELPVEDRYINEILLLTSSNKVYASVCAQALAKRIGRTRNWIVALKSLMIVLRVFQDGDPYFPRDVLLIMKRGGRILNLNNFRDDYNSSPWDYTAFVRMIALYLNERLECFITGRLQRRMVKKTRDQFSYHPNRQRYNEHVSDMKPAVLIDKIKHWQILLQRAIATRPTGVAKNNRLVQISLYAIVRETFDLYRDISDGITLLLDNFFHMPQQNCIEAFQVCITSSEQFDELNRFYKSCNEIGVGRTSEYPSIQKISPELMETLQEFLKDKTSYPDKPQTSPQLCLPPPNRHGSSVNSDNSRATLLEDLISATELPTSSSLEDFQSMYTSRSSIDQERNSECSGKQSSVEDMLSMHTAGTSPARSTTTTDQRSNSIIDLLSFDEPQNDANQPSTSGQHGECRDEWELVLAETASNISASPQKCIAYELAFPDNLNNEVSTSFDQSNYNNPFLSLDNELAIVPSPPVSLPTFQAASAPTFCAQNPSDIMENDLFSPRVNAVQMSSSSSQGPSSQPHFLFEQQLWLQNQNQIMAKHIS